MAENATDNTEANEEKPKGKMGGMIKVGGLIAVVMIVEAVVAMMLIPSGQEVQAMAEAEYGPVDAVDPLAELAMEEDGEPTGEVDLGKFSVAAYQPLSNTTLRIDFHLYGIVHKTDLAEFETTFADIEKRLQDRVISTVRSSEVNDLTDASLSLIKRKLLEKTNRTLGKPLVKQVVFSEFSFVEQ